jgi:hypothetical protein
MELIENTKVNRIRELPISPPVRLTSRLEKSRHCSSPGNYYFILSGSTIKKPFKQSRMLKRFRCAVAILAIAMYCVTVVKSNFVVQSKKRLKEVLQSGDGKLSHSPSAFRKEGLSAEHKFCIDGAGTPVKS